MKIIEAGFELVVDSILRTLHSEAFERNFAGTVRKRLSRSSSNNHHNNNRTHRKSRQAAARESRRLN